MISRPAAGKESHPVRNLETIAAPRSRSLVGWLCLLWLATALARFAAGMVLHGPVMFGDEVLYWEIARSFYRFGSFEMYLTPGRHLPTVLYSILIAPAFAWHSPQMQYLLARLISSLLMASAVFPTYGLAREFLDEKWSLVAALMTALSTGGIFSAVIMSESLFLPTLILTAWLCFRTLDRGRLLDAVGAGVLLALGFHVKIQMMFLAVAYVVPYVTWIIVTALNLDARKSWTHLLRETLVRAIPGLIFGAILSSRLAIGLAQFESARVAIFGSFYADLANPSGSPSLRWLSTTLLGMFEVLTISTLFLPVSALLLGARMLRRLPFRLVIEWLLTTSCTLVFLVMVARHNSLYDDRIRVYERYFSMLVPLLWIWFLSVKTYLKSRAVMLTIAALLAVCVWTLVPTPPTTYVNWDSSSDSPTLTTFFHLQLGSFSSGLQWPTLIVLLVVAALSVYGMGRKQSETAAISWALALLILNSGWYLYEYERVAPTQLRPRRAILEMRDRLTDRDKVAVVYDGKEPLNAVMFTYFWLANPLTLYVPPGTTLWYGKIFSVSNSKPDPTQMPSDYVIYIGRDKLDLPVVQRWADERMTLYRGYGMSAVK